MQRRPSRKKKKKKKGNVVSFSINLKKQRGEKQSLMSRRSVYLSPLAVKGRFIMGFFSSSPLFFYSLLHYLVSWNHRLSQSPLSPLSNRLQKVPSKPWPIPHGQPGAWSSEIAAPPPNTADGWTDGFPGHQVPGSQFQ